MELGLGCRDARISSEGIASETEAGQDLDGGSGDEAVGDGGGELGGDQAQAVTGLDLPPAGPTEHGGGVGEADADRKSVV